MSLLDTLATVVEALERAGYWAYLRRWAAELGLDELLIRATEELD